VGRCTAGELENLRVVGERPLVVIVDDLQNLDLDGSGLLDSLTSSEGVLVLAAADPSHDSSIWARLRRRLSSRQALVEVPLRALEKRELKQLLETSLAESVGEGTVERMMEVSGGIPSLAIEHLDWLRGTRRLVFQNGRWHWNAGCFGQSALPPSMENAGQQIIGQLQWRPLLVLAYLALLEGPAERTLLECLLEQDSETVAALIHDLEKAGLVTTSGSLAEPQVSLAHRWFSSLIQSRIGQTRLAELNLRLARKLERNYQADPEPGRLAEMIRHFAEGKDRSKVAQYLLACLEDLEKRGSPGGRCPSSRAGESEP
jgi:predicted ATPase